MIQKPKGTYDVINSNYTWLIIEELFKNTCENAGYKYIRTPIFEHSELFHRSVGETTDIITKETYDFTDKKNRKLTLRPELTAGIARAFIENKLYANPDFNKVYSFGPCYRYERPQNGRNREFYQAGVEVFHPSDPIIDAEVINIAYQYLSSIGLEDLTVYINSLGSTETKEIYKKELCTYLDEFKSSLCSDCQTRLAENPLRVLDCKIDQDHEALVNAPSFIDYLNDQELAYFTKLQLYLTILNIPYQVDEKLVRGLDYYTSTVFEIKVNNNLLANQNTIAGGGRYDNLIASLDGPDTNVMGFGIGVDRLIYLTEKLHLNDYEKEIKVKFIPLNDDALAYQLNIVNELQKNDISIELTYTVKSLSKALKSVKEHVQYIVIIGEDELNTGEFKIRNNRTGEEHTVNNNDLIDWFINN